MLRPLDSKDVICSMYSIAFLTSLVMNHYELAGYFLVFWLLTAFRQQVSNFIENTLHGD